jgi:molybdopterin converting factor subunit 1
MRVTVKLFAILKERAGISEFPLELPCGSATSVALESIASRHPNIRELLRRAAVAVNREYAPRDTTLNDGDELALIPPVSGG